MKNMQDKKEKLLLTFAKIVTRNRGNKSMSTCSYEVDISKSIWSKIESGDRDAQLSTIWRIAESLNIKPSELFRQMELELGSDFSFIE